MTLLLLAGTREARDLAARLADAGVDAVASLAGATADPVQFALPTRSGGFGGADGFRAYVRAGGITSVIDATHPFAARITPRTLAICKDCDIPFLRLERPGWTPGQDDRWSFVAAAGEPAGRIGREAIVFLATGRQSLPDFAALACRAVYLRQIDPPDRPFPFASGGYVIGRPPFTVEDEVDTFRRLGVTDLVVKDAGGTGGRAKLDAAAVLGIRVWMIRRPARGMMNVVETVEEALAWAMSPSG